MRKARTSSIVALLTAVLLAAPAVASAAKKVTRSGGYRVTVSGTATRNVATQDRYQCDGGGYDTGTSVEVLSGSYRATMPARTETIPRVSFSGGPYHPWGALRGYTLLHTTTETYDDFRECETKGTKITPTCTESRPQTVSRSERVVIGADGPKRVLIGTRGNDDGGGLGLSWFLCAPFGVDPFKQPKGVPEALRYLGTSPFKIVKLSLFEKQKSGTITLSDTRPLKFEVPGMGETGLTFTGTVTVELEIKWRRVRSTPPFEAEL